MSCMSKTNNIVYFLACNNVPVKAKSENDKVFIW